MGRLAKAGRKANRNPEVTVGDGPDVPDTKKADNSNSRNPDAPESENTPPLPNNEAFGPPAPDIGRIDNFVAGAPDRIADLRGGLTNSTGARSGTVAIADVDIDGIPNQLAAHSRIDNAGNGFLGDGSRSLPATPEKTKAGNLVFRDVDAEFKILDNISDQLSNNRNARGSLTIFVELPPCNSCANVALKEFRRRHPNIQVQILNNDGVRLKPTRPTPPPQPTTRD